MRPCEIPAANCRGDVNQASLFNAFDAFGVGQNDSDFKYKYTSTFGDAKYWGF